MALNSSAFATNFTGELDKIVTQKSAVGFLTDNAFKAKFVGAKTVKIPNISLQGLGSYDRDNGFTKGTLSISNTAYTMTQDRSRSFNIDREDLDETGIAELAGEVLGEFVRTKVVPEVDAYTLSKMTQTTLNNSNAIFDYDIEKPYEAFNYLADKVHSEVGFDEEIICFMSRYMWNKLRGSDEFTRILDISHLKKGEVSFDVQKIDNIRIIPVPDSRMYTRFDFASGSNNTAGGFAPSETSYKVYMIMCPKKAVSLVKKSEKLRIFTPDQNIDCDAYKFDYRIYYDAFVKSGLAKSIYSIVEPGIGFDEDLDDTLSLQQGESETLSVRAYTNTKSALRYQWYYCSDAEKTQIIPIDGATKSSYEIPDDLDSDTYYYFVRVSSASRDEDSNVITVTVS